MMKLIFLISLLLTNKKVSKLHVAYENGLSVNVRYSRTPSSKTIHLRKILPLTYDLIDLFSLLKIMK